MKEEYQDRADALLKGLKSNPKDDPAYQGGSGSSSGLSGGAPGKKKKKKLFLVLIPLLLLLGVGAFVGLVFVGVVRNPQLEALLKIKRKAPAAKPTVEVAKNDPPATDTPPDPELPGVGKKPGGKTKAAPVPKVDPQKGNQKIATDWGEMDADKVAAMAPEFKDQEFADILAEMEADKTAAILSALDPKRAGKISKLIQARGSIIPVDDQTQ